MSLFKTGYVIKLIPLSFLGFWAFLSLVMVVRNTNEPLGGNDLYTYWYSGHFVRMQKDPYQAFQENLVPNLPFQYINGTAYSLDQIILPKLVPAPGYTFPLILFFTLFSFLTWDSAKWVWLMLNIGFVLSITPLIFKYLYTNQNKKPWHILGMCLVLMGLTSTRYALSSGQVTFFILFFILITLILSKNNPLLAGLFLGISLSKYSLSIGLLVYFLFINPNLKLVFSALITQIVGIVALIFISGASFDQILSGYTSLFAHHAPMDGIHLSSLINSTDILFDLGIGITITLAVVLPFWFKKKSISTPLDHFLTISGLLGWSLLVGYHRLYDTVGLIFFYCIILVVLTDHNTKNLNHSHKLFLIIFSVSSLVILMFPAGSVARSILPIQQGSDWVNLVSRLTTFITLATTGISFWLLTRLTSTHKNKTIRFEE